MSKGSKRQQAVVTIKLHPDAAKELREMDGETAADVLAVISKLQGRTHQELVAMLDTRSEPKVVQFERSHKRGGLRVVLAWGKGTLWYIGSVVKSNDAEGERLVKRILPRADDVKDAGV